MNSVKAIYRRGVFEPLEPVDLREEEQVELSIEPQRDARWKSWAECVQKTRAEIEKREGVLPDSSTDIAEDRKR